MVPRIGLLLLCVLAGACGRDSASPAAPTLKRPLEIASVRELGPLGRPASVTVRDGGASAVLGGRLLWTFADTLFSPQSIDGTNLRSNTAGLADPASPLVISEPVDARGAPFPFLPFTPEEQAFNDSTGRPDRRIALWPGSVVPDGSGAGLVFYLKLEVNPGLLNYAFIGTGIARVPPASTAAQRDPDLLFRVPEPTFDHAAVLDSQLYVFGAIHDGTPDQPFGVGRAPLARARERAAYVFWDGSAWVSDARRTARVLTGIPGGVSVSYNEYLGQYLAVHSLVLSSVVVMHVADRPEGPWGPAVPAFTGLPVAAGSFSYAGREHPHLASQGGRTVFVTYFHPLGAFRGDLRLVEVTFR